MSETRYEPAKRNNTSFFQENTTEVRDPVEELETCRYSGTADLKEPRSSYFNYFQVGTAFFLLGFIVGFAI